MVRDNELLRRTAIENTQLIAESNRLRAEVVRLQTALKGLLSGCVALDPEQSILPQQMKAADEALASIPTQDKWVCVPRERVREVYEWLWGDAAYAGDTLACQRELRSLLSPGEATDG